MKNPAGVKNIAGVKSTAEAAVRRHPTMVAQRATMSGKE